MMISLRDLLSSWSIHTTCPSDRFYLASKDEDRRESIDSERYIVRLSVDPDFDRSFPVSLASDDELDVAWREI